MVTQQGVALSSSAGTSRNDDFRTEQAYLTRLYQRLDEVRDQAAERLRAILLEAGGTPQGRSHREATHSHYADQLGQLNAVENRLCFGRLDFSEGDPRYIGRINLSAEAEPKLDEAAISLARELARGLPEGSELLGPAPMFRVRNRHRRRILIKADDRAGTVAAVRDAVEGRAADRSLKDVAIGVDVDPQ